MVQKKFVVMIVALALVAVALGGAYIVLTQTPSGRPSGVGPTVTFTSPAYAATGAAINTKLLATFSDTMDPSTITTSTFSLKTGTTLVSGTVSQIGKTATFATSGMLAASTSYTATITTGAKAVAGTPLAVPFVWTFVTGLVPDTTPPLVVSTSPVLAVALNSSIAATFSEAMDPLTITTSTFTLQQGTTPVSGVVSYAGLTATFAPAAVLASDMTYTATITIGAKDLAGNALAVNFVWSFTTSTSSSACSQASVALGSAARFAVLAGATVTNTGATTVTGDLGVSPGTAVTGFPPGTVVGTIHAGDSPAAGAIADLTIAYNDAKGRTLCPITLAGNLGGLTLTPGLYKSTSSLEISSGDLTLDAQASPNAVFIFQMASTLVTTVGRQVILAGGAQASNIFWQVGSSATFGTTSAFIGNVMADQSITMTTGATLNGRALARIAAVTMDTNTVTFGPIPDTTPPLVTFTSPVYAATGTPINTKVLATFSEAMNPLTINASTFTVQQGTTPVSGVVSYTGTTATFVPSSSLASSTSYTATITTGAKDLAGNALAVNFVWSFVTGLVADTTPPLVVSTSPVLAVAVNSNIAATFSETMDPSTITTSTFTVKQGTTPVSGVVSYAGLTATFDPASILASDATYTATITNGAKDLAGNALAVNFVWTFTTSTSLSACSQTSVALGSAAGFAVLAGSTVTNTGATMVTGDLGLSPGTAVTGFPPGTVVGTIHAADPVAAGAIANLTIAYNDAKGRTLCPITLAGNLGGLTLTPGLYKSSSSLEISSGDLTLDAQGNASAVFIFQMASTLITTVGRQVILAGSAQASNIFWQVGSSATLGTNSVFVGTIMADQSISFVTNATLNGRALARIAAVTMDTNTVRSGPIPDTTPPLVTFTSPAYAATVVPINTKILATFSEAMNPSTITTSTFTFQQGTTPVSGIVSYTGTTATFVPSSSLASSTSYTATITTGAKDLAGNALAVNFVWSFTTGPIPDTTPPLVTFTSPAYGATGTPINTKVLTTFSEAMDPLTITTSTFALMQGTTPVSGLVTYAGLTATFVPSSNLASSTSYTATITTGTKDLAGNALLSAFVWSFTTGPIPDTTPPLVVSTGPVLAVAVNSNIAATFSEAMDPLTITVATFTLQQGTTPVSGLVTYAGLTATLDPIGDLASNTMYRATITTGTKDLAGNALAVNFVWTFTTSTSLSACSQTSVALGSAAGFAVLAGSTVTNTGATMVTGDLGLSPGTAVTGFPPGTVVGTIHAGDLAAAQAEANLTIAYNDAKGRTLCPITLAGNLGGLTLTPGLYKSTSSLEISSGDLTLDAQGNASAVFIFQMASTLITTAGRRVILAGGAQASNIFWQVGSSATLGTNSVFVGTIMADQSVTLYTSATLNGRALARIAAVTLDTNTVTKP